MKDCTTPDRFLTRDQLETRVTLLHRKWERLINISPRRESVGRFKRRHMKIAAVAERLRRLADVLGRFR